MGKFVYAAASALLALSTSAFAAEKTVTLSVENMTAPPARIS
jgi:hypothetical protein